MSQSDQYKIKNCRICKSDKLFPFLDLGAMPVPNGFLKKEALNEDEPRYPLATCVCESCWLVQLTHVIPPEQMFSNYLYIPSTSSTMLDHFNTLALKVIERFRPRVDDLIIDIGSNDGTLLNFFRKRGLSVLGIDPANNLAQLARMKGVNTINSLFTASLAKEMASKGVRPKVITATNVIAHIHDIHDMCEGIKTLLAEEGVFVMEFPYLVDLLQSNEFDTIYHEHLSYFSLSPLISLFDQHGLMIFDLFRSSVHGGSIRVFVGRKNSIHKISIALEKQLEDEKNLNLDSRKPYQEFAERVAININQLSEVLRGIKAEGKRIIGYGASAKGNVLLNYGRISNDLIEYIVDSISYKQWMYTPGTHIPIYPEEKLEQDNPDYVLLMAWNFKDEILKKQAKFREAGGRFILPVPQVQII